MLKKEAFLSELKSKTEKSIEALKGKEYEIRLHNPFPVRVAVALSVDGLNTIDAQHTTAAHGRKWVIGPYETITISGWQTGRTVPAGWLKKRASKSRRHGRQ
jgi:hypothetical protein